MQVRCPELLITNYSMLEYMLMRPLSRGRPIAGLISSRWQAQEIIVCRLNGQFAGFGRHKVHCRHFIVGAELEESAIERHRFVGQRWSLARCSGVRRRARSVMPFDTGQC